MFELVFFFYHLCLKPGIFVCSGMITLFHIAADENTRLQTQMIEKEYQLKHIKIEINHMRDRILEAGYFRLQRHDNAVSYLREKSVQFEWRSQVSGCGIMPLQTKIPGFKHK
jgi:hypothetical protein